jgi:hypothetical protein
MLSEIQQLPRWYCNDDDGEVTQTVAAMKERQGKRLRTLAPNMTARISFKPKVHIFYLQYCVYAKIRSY